MSSGLIWLAPFLLLPLAGLPLLTHGTFRPFPLGSRAILAGGVGAVLVSFAMTLFALFGAPWSLVSVMLTAGLLAFALRAVLRNSHPSPPPPPPERRERVVAGVANLLALVAVLAALAATARGAATSPDLVFFWGAKAQQYAVVGTIDVGFLRDELHQYMHPYYPPLVTNVDAFASIAAGRFSWTAAVLTFPLLLGALALGLPGILRMSMPRPAAAATSALVVASIGYLGMEADIGGNGDMPLLFFETLAVALLLSPAASGAAGQGLVGLLLAGAASTKVEGLPLALAAAALFLVFGNTGSEASFKAALRLLLPMALVLGAWFAFGATRRLFYGYSEYGRLLDVHLDHARAVGRAIGQALAVTGHGLPYLIPLVGLLAAGRPGRRALVPLGAAASLAAFALFTYLHRAEDPSQWISWSAARVLSPLPMLFALASTCARTGEGEAGERRRREGSPG